MRWAGRGRLRDLTSERQWFGYRPLLVLLCRKDEPSGISRIYGLYREDGPTRAFCNRHLG